MRSNLPQQLMYKVVSCRGSGVASLDGYSGVVHQHSNTLSLGQRTLQFLETTRLPRDYQSEVFATQPVSLHD